MPLARDDTKVSSTIGMGYTTSCHRDSETSPGIWVDEGLSQAKGATTPCKTRCWSLGHQAKAPNSLSRACNKSSLIVDDQIVEWRALIYEKSHRRKQDITLCYLSSDGASDTPQRHHPLQCFIESASSGLSSSRNRLHAMAARYYRA